MVAKTFGFKFSELNAVILPSGRMELEWNPVEDPIGRDQRLLQDELWKRIGEDYESFLLFLGFSDLSVPLSVSLDYWRKVTGRFAEELVRTTWFGCDSAVAGSPRRSLKEKTSNKAASAA